MHPWHRCSLPSAAFLAHTKCTYLADSICLHWPLPSSSLVFEAFTLPIALQKMLFVYVALNTGEIFKQEESLSEEERLLRHYLPLVISFFPPRPVKPLSITLYRSKPLNTFICSHFFRWLLSPGGAGCWGSGWPAPPSCRAVTLWTTSTLMTSFTAPGHQVSTVQYSTVQYRSPGQFRTNPKSSELPILPRALVNA